MRYVDGFILPVPEKNLEIYRNIARKAGKVWREHGALQYVEAAADDLDVKFGLPYTRVIKAKPGETIVISFIVLGNRTPPGRNLFEVILDFGMTTMLGPAGRR